MADVKGLCNIGRRILYDDLFASSRIIATITWDFRGREMGEGVHLREDFTNKGRARALKVQEGFVGSDRLDVLIGLELRVG